MAAFNVLIAGTPYGCQSARSDGTWLTDAQRRRIQGISGDIRIFHPSVGELNNGGAVPRPNALLVETSGTERSWESLPDVVFGPVFQRLLTPELRFVQSASAGVEHLLPLVPEDVPLCNASGVHANAIAETVCAVILGRAKLLAQRRRDQEDRIWRQLPCKEVTGSEMCIVGTGRIGSEVAKLAKALGMSTTGVRRDPKPAAFFDSTISTSGLGDVLARADYVVLACPLTPETKGIIGASTLARLRDGAYLINVARGALIDEEAVIGALSSGKLSGAFLDALLEEPLPQDHPFWSMSTVTITPHDSHASQLMGDRHVDLFCENLARHLSQEPLLNVVDRSRGY